MQAITGLRRSKFRGRLPVPQHTFVATENPAFVRLAQSVVAILLAAACIAVFVPFSPAFPGAGLDSGWAFALNEAVEKHFVFGKDIVFTYGPYAAALTRQYHFATDSRMLWSSAILAVALASGIFILARDRLKLSALLIVPFLAFFQSEALFFCIPLVFVMLIARMTFPPAHQAHLRSSNAVLCAVAALVVSSSLLPLMKGNFAVATTAILIISLSTLAVAGRFVLAGCLALIFIVGVAGFWVVADQPLASLPAFFASQVEFIAGYSDAMSSSGPGIEIVAYIAACLVLGITNYHWLRSSNRPGFALGLGVTLLLFVAFKEGFVRHDGHALIASAAVSLFVVILAVGLPLPRLPLALVACLVCAGVIEFDYNRLEPSTVAGEVISPFVDAATGLLSRVQAPDALREGFDDQIASIRRQAPLPSLTGGTDTYSFGQSRLLANGLDFDPRPVFQSYSAYTPALLEANAAHLVGDAAPRNILFAVQPIDSRLPSLDDGASWPLLLTRYDPVALTPDGVAILRQRSAPTTDQPLPASPNHWDHYRLKRTIPLPVTDSPLWAQIDAKPSVLGQLAKIIFKLPKLKIEFRMSDGSVRKYRYIADIGERGFVVSPLVSDTRDFLALVLPGRTAYFSQSRPVSMSIYPAGGVFERAFWGKDIRVQFSELNLPAQTSGTSVVSDFFQPLNDEPDAQDAGLAKTPDCSIDGVNGQSIDQRPPNVQGHLHVYGWGVVSMNDNLAPTQTKIVLIGEKGDVHAAVARSVPRPDVNAHFGRPKLGDVGFDAFVDVSKLNGLHDLKIRVSANGAARECAASAKISFVGPSSEAQ
ncbi:MAG TPA: hypothetical protein VGH40_20360 [Roseiarcus sp.]|jgi:hypothetical protein